MCKINVVSCGQLHNLLGPTVIVAAQSVPFGRNNGNSLGNCSEVFDTSSKYLRIRIFVLSD